MLSLNFLKKLIIRKKNENPLVSVYDPLSVKLLTQLRIGFSHLNGHKLMH